MKCVACGSVALVEGALVENAGNGTSIFVLKDTSIWKSMFGVGARTVSAYGCIDCQHLQLTVNFSEEDLQRYKQLDNKQPGALE